MANKTKPRISIIIPVYNVEKWLRDCLDSVVNQDATDFEAILVNDGSTDASMEIMEEYGKRYPFFHTYTKKNGGLSSARNFGMRQANGDYIYFLDSDDKFYDEHCISFMIRELQDSNLDVVCFDGETFFETQELQEKNPAYRTAYQRKNSYGDYEYGCDLFADLVHNQDYYPSACLACYRKDYLEENELRFDEGYLYEDNLFTFKVLLLGKKVRHQAHKVLSRRIRYGSIMQSLLRWNNAKSYFHAWVCMKEFWKTRSFTPFVELAISSIINGMKAGLIGVWNGLPLEEQQEIQYLSAYERHEMEALLPCDTYHSPENFIFPYALLPQNTVVALYGAGKVGTSFYRQAIHSGLVKIAAFVDSNATSMSHREEPIQSPQVLKEVFFDIVLIAVEKEEVANKIREDLREMDISNEKIKWYGRFYRWNEAHGFLISLLRRYLYQLNERIPRKFWLLLLPEHGNMGDYAIGYAAQKFLQENFPDIPRIDVTDLEWKNLSEQIKPLIQRKDVIFFNGGGDFGDLWETGRIQRSIVEMFPENKIIFLPNTLTYREEISEKNDALMRDMEYYSKKKNVHILFREHNSYDFCQKYLERTACVPDLVLSEIYPRRTSGKKHTALLCFRSDKESIFRGADRVKTILRENQWTFEEMDVHQMRPISQEDGREVLHQIIEKLQSVEVVITDRLHGMILSVVSQVPCIAFDNRTKKISGVYAWIENNPNVLLGQEDFIENLMDWIGKVTFAPCHFTAMEKEFSEMADYVKRIIAAP